MRCALLVFLALPCAAASQTFTVRPAQTFTVRPAAVFVVKPAVNPAPTPEEQWRRDGWRQDARGQWYRWLTPVTPAWSGGPGRQYAAPVPLLRGGSGC